MSINADVDEYGGNGDVDVDDGGNGDEGGGYARSEMTKMMTTPTMLMLILMVARMSGMTMVVMMAGLVMMVATMSMASMYISILNSHMATCNRQ